MNIQELMYRKVLDSLIEGVYFVDRDRTITFWSRSAERITGFEASEVVGTRCMDNVLNHVDVDGRQLCRSDCPLMRCFKEGREVEAEVYFHHKSGHRIPVHVRATPLRDATGAITGAVETFMDTSSQVSNVAKINELRELALLDPTTQLGNRRYTEQTIERRLEELRRYGWKFGVLFMDIDSFKMVNDTYGHETGDRALELIATTLQKSLRPFDFAGRWGGDEFVALLVNVDADDLRRIAERVRLLVTHSNVKRFANPLWITVSVGATMARAGDSAASLLKRADTLMYRSKETGKNRVTCDGDLLAGAGRRSAGERDASADGKATSLEIEQG